MTEHLPAAGGILRFVEPEKQLVLAGFREDLQLARRVGQAVFNGLVHAAYEPLGVLNDLDALFHRHLEHVFHACHGTALENVVRQASDGGERGKQLTEHRGIVVHAAQQHGLIAHDAPGTAQRGDRGGGFRRDLPRVVELRHNKDRFPRRIARERFAERLVDPFRPGDGRACAEADVVQMADGRERVEIARDRLVAVEERIAAGEEHVRDLLMLADVSGHALKVRRDLLVRQPHEALSEAVAAVHGASVRCEHHGGLQVFVLEAGDARVGLLAARIKRAAFLLLDRRGHRHFPDRIVRVVRVDQPQIIGRDAHGVAVCHRLYGGKLFGCHGQLFRKLRGCRDPHCRRSPFTI